MDKFSPSASTTRGMLMTVLARYAGEDTTGGATWYEKGMNWAEAKGVSDGTNPNADITREQLGYHAVPLRRLPGGVRVAERASRTLQVRQQLTR